MKHYYFPLLFLTPDFDGDEIVSGHIAVVRRRWNVSLFDLATLATKHDLHLPYQAMDLFLNRCNLELRVSSHESHEDAATVFSNVRLGLYAAGMSPFLCPFICTHSVNEYSAINDRDSDCLRQKLTDERKDGITSETARVSAWPWEMSFACVTLKLKLNASTLRFSAGVATAESWRAIVKAQPKLRVVEDTAAAAPMLGNIDQSLLHVWSAMESLFPDVRQELSFRLAIYIAQLIMPTSGRLELYHRVRKPYGVRSDIAHGTRRGIIMEEWQDAWELLMGAVNAIVRRGAMPSEKYLISELMGDPIVQ